MSQPDDEFDISLPMAEGGSSAAGGDDGDGGEERPERSGFRKYGVIGILLILLAIALLVGISQCQPKVSSKDSPSTATSATAQPSPSATGEGEGIPNGGPVSSGASDNGGDETTDATEAPVSESRQINRVDPSGVSGEFTAQAFVLDKYAYVQNGQYQYVIDISVSHGSGKSVNLKYLTTRSGYDSVEIGNIFDITYGADDQGNVSITNLTRK